MNVCYSGGAIGADSIWGKIATKFNHTVIHYSFGKHNSKCDSLNRLLPEQLREADPYLFKATRMTERMFPCGNDYVNSLLRRNYWQIKESDSLYAVSSIINGKVSGGTAWAVAMFIQNRTGPCYVFDQKRNAWFIYDRNKKQWIRMNELPPVPSGKWTGIGTRDINNNGEDAIKCLFSERQ